MPNNGIIKHVPVGLLKYKDISVLIVVVVLYINVS